MSQKQSGVRNSAMELLRIISIVMIMFHHFAIHGGFEFGATFTIPHLWYNLIMMGGKIGVNIFVLISGYFLISNDRKFFDINKIIKLVGQVLFYSVGFLLIGKLTGIIDWNSKTLIKSLFPITFSKWWFASAYFVLYLVHPYLNKLLRSLDKSVYQGLLLLLVVCWSIIPTFTASSFQSNSLLWFVTLYSIAGYIRLYGFNEKFSTKHYFISYLICSVITYASSVVFTLLGTRWSVFAEKTTYFYEQESLTILLTSLCLFMCFATLKMNYYKWINILASATFGVYLIHDNDFTRQLLWVHWFKNAQYQNRLFLIPYSVIVVVVVFAVCVLVDLLRLYIVEKPCMKLVKRHSSKITAPIEKIADLLKAFAFGK